MKKSEIVVGGHYVAKVSNRLVTVRVDSITESEGRPARNVPASPYGTGLGAYRAKAIKSVTYYDVTNLATGRKVVFRSAAKFRYKVGPLGFPQGPKTEIVVEGEKDDRPARTYPGLTGPWCNR